MSASKKLILRSVQFQGANGFPMAMYRPVLSLMRTRVLALLDNKGYEVENKSNFSISGCDLFPYVHTGEDWTAMVQHLEKEVEQKSEGAEKNPLIFMGHSFGECTHFISHSRNRSCPQSRTLLVIYIYALTLQSLTLIHPRVHSFAQYSLTHSHTT
jgi:hypothetical protein